MSGPVLRPSMKGPSGASGPTISSGFFVMAVPAVGRFSNVNWDMDVIPPGTDGWTRHWRPLDDRD